MKARYGKRGDKAQRRREQRVIKQIGEWVAKGWAVRFLVDTLNEQKWSPAPEGGKWTRTTVERLIDANPRRMRVENKRLEKDKAFNEQVREAQEQQAKAGLHQIDFDRTQDREDRPGVDPRATTETEVLTEAEWQELKEAARLGTEAFKAEEEHRRTTPKDWATMKDFAWTAMYAQDDYRRLGLAGQDSWAREVMPVMAEQVARTGKPVMDLLDEVEGHAAAKGQLRRLWLGVLRQLAMERETVEALRARVAVLEGREG